LFCILSQTKLISWNIANFGQSKSDKTIHYIANYLRDYDIIAVQVVAGYGGVQAVARLSDELNRTGSKWDYIISDPTSSSPYKRALCIYMENQQT
jgi:intracellular sulfur oxidation DsrE/DsrF family protein